MSLSQNLRFGARLALRQPGLTAIAVLALTLGIGLTTMMFSIIEGAILRGLPFEEADRIAAVSNTDTTRPSDDQMDVMPHDFVEWRAAQKSFEIFAAQYSGTVNVSGPEGRPDRYSGAFMTANGFDVVRVAPLLGRTFVEGDDRPGAPPVVVLGYPVWQNRFGGDPNIVGKVIRVNGRPTTIVGVMPEGFKFPISQDIWVPLTLDVLRQKRGEGTYVMAMGRLRPGVSFDEAQAEFTTLAQQQAKQYPETNEHRGALVRPYIRRFMGNDVHAMLFTMLGAVFGVLLIACANVANLLLARSVVRTKEMAVRTALGAGRGRIIGQMLAEAFVLAAIGTALGVALAQAGIAIFNRAIVDTEPPFWIDIRLDPIVLLFTTGLTCLAALASGTIPAIQASRADVNDVLKDESRGASSLRIGRFSRGLVIGEIALSCGLLVAAGLAIKSIVNLAATDYGFATEEVFTARVGLFPTDYPDAAARARFFLDLHRRLQALPGAKAAAITTNLPAMGADRPALTIEGRTYATDRDHPSAGRVAATPGFAATFGRQLLRGRDFTDADDAGAPRVAIVNESFAAKLFPSEDPIGRRFRTFDREQETPWITVVGLAPDLYTTDIRNEDPEGYYVPLAQEPPNFASLAVLAQGAPMQFAGPVQSAVNAIDPDLPLYWLRTQGDAIAENNWHYRVMGSLFMVFGIAALFLATVGLYGVMSFSVSRRTQEIGVRMALGAEPARVLSLVLRQGLVQLVIGIVIGTGLAAMATPLMQILLLGVDPRDPATFLTVVLALAAAALAAMLIPARRAMRVEPMAALRYE
jgi:predicted permease